jgi:hypothetical protein
MAASDHLGQRFRMPVSELLDMHSTEALRQARNAFMRQPPTVGEEMPGHSDATKVGTLYDRKARDFETEPGYRRLDGPIRAGSIDPVVLQPNRETGGQEVYEGAHRIIRAHQLGVTHLPVSTSWDSQKHYDEWEPEAEMEAG